MRLHDVDLDTQRDELRVLHVRAGQSSCTLKHSSLQEGVWLYGGYIKIQFTVHHRTRSGRGFIMSYKSNSIHYTTLVWVGGTDWSKRFSNYRNREQNFDSRNFGLPVYCKCFETSLLVWHLR